MQLHLKREEQKRGMLKKKLYYVLRAQIETTPEEAEVIKKAGIGDRVIFTYYNDDMRREDEVPVKHFLGSPMPFGSDQLDQIAAWEEEIKDAARNLKE